MCGAITADQEWEDWTRRWALSFSDGTALIASLTSPTCKMKTSAFLSHRRLCQMSNVDHSLQFLECFGYVLASFTKV